VPPEPFFPGLERVASHGQPQPSRLKAATGSESAVRVTVLVPCYNDGPLMLEAVDSIDEHEPVDVLVVDDCSEDPETIRAFEQLDAGRATVIRLERNEGLAVARNTALARARTPYVFPLDADDLSMPGVLGKMADKLDADPGVAVCFGDYLEFGRQQLVRAVPPDLDAYRLAYVNEYPVSSLFRRRDLLAVGGWQDLTPGYEDWNLWLTLVEHGYRGAHLGPGIVTYQRRLHGERLLTRAKRQHRSHYRQIRAAHPDVFANLGRHRRASDLAAHRKLLYPIVYGSRPRFAFEQSIKRLLDRAGVWTLRR
jgi:glycosyltransferase involved in cell wall biosynthesis